MEPSTSRRENVEPEADVNDLTNRFIGIRCNESINDVSIVILDLDVTDLTRNKEICQIAAQCNGNNFNQYIIPNRNISRNCSAYHGMKIKCIRKQRILHHYENEVIAVSIEVGLTNFLDYLSNQSGRVFLAAHNCLKFDCWTIIRLMRDHGLILRFESLVMGFIDTERVFRSLEFCAPRIVGNQNFKLPSLAADYLDVNQIPEIHHAVTNVQILVDLITRIGCTTANMIQHARNLASFMKKIPEDVDKRVIGLRPLEGDISPTMIKKIARAGITIAMLKSMYNLNGDDGVTRLLRGDIDGFPRVTNNRGIIQIIIARLRILVLANNEEAPI